MCAIAKPFFPKHDELKKFKDFSTSDAIDNDEDDGQLAQVSAKLMFLQYTRSLYNITIS